MTESPYSRIFLINQRSIQTGTILTNKQILTVILPSLQESSPHLLSSIEREYGTHTGEGKKKALAQSNTTNLVPPRLRLIDRSWTLQRKSTLRFNGRKMDISILKSRIKILVWGFFIRAGSSSSRSTQTRLFLMELKLTRKWGFGNNLKRYLEKLYI